jgi:hypothetical protein
MVRIEFNDADQVNLQISGYQYPKIDDKDYDGNWLNVYIEINSRIGKWRTIDPSLLTWELEELIEAFGKYSREEFKNIETISFIEPNLEFTFGPTENGKIHLKMIFSLESKPKSWSGDEECSLEGDLTPQALSEIRAELEGELSKYPKRL